jgi:hypothetical protein
VTISVIRLSDGFHMEATSIVSYSHDSSEHDERVLRLAERLRHDGID